MKTPKEVLDKYVNIKHTPENMVNAIVKAMNEYAGQWIQSGIDHVEKKSNLSLFNKLFPKP